MANLGAGLGGLLSGFAGGVGIGNAVKSMGKGGMGGKLLSGGAAESVAPTGFGLGEKLVGGALGNSSMAGDDKSSPWSSLSSIIAGIGSGTESGDW